MMLDTASFRMRWELHTEFSSYTFFRPLKAGEPLDPDATAFAAAHPDWLAGIPGRLMVATHVELRSTSEISPESVLASLTQSGRTMVAARVAEEMFKNHLFTPARTISMGSNETIKQAVMAGMGISLSLIHISEPTRPY